MSRKARRRRPVAVVIWHDDLDVFVIREGKQVECTSARGEDELHKIICGVIEDLKRAGVPRAEWRTNHRLCGKRRRGPNLVMYACTIFAIEEK